MGGGFPADLPVAALEILVYRIQAAVLGGLRKAMVHVLRQHKVQELRSSDTRPFEIRIPTTGMGPTSERGTPRPRPQRQARTSDGPGERLRLESQDLSQSVAECGEAARDRP
jgi:hypothetical protein